MKVFNCGTRFDIYLLQHKIKKNFKTKIKDEQNVIYNINLHEFYFLPNSRCI